MNNHERIAGLKEGEYQQLVGVKKNIFEKMLTILQEKFHAEHLRGGHPPKLCVLDKLIITLGYYREYRTMQISPSIMQSPKARSAKASGGWKRR